MTMTFAINQLNNDMIIGLDGKLVKVWGAEEVRQRILITLQHYYQEYFLNTPGGVPWYEIILGSKDLRIVDALLRKAILEVPNVLSIIDFQMSLVNRQLSVSSTVEVDGLSSPQTVDVVATILNGRVIS